MRGVEHSGRLDLAGLNGAAESNLRGMITWSSPVTMNAASGGTALIVAHDLGLVPSEISVQPWVDARWWAGSAERLLWTDRIIVLRVSAAGRYTVRAGAL